MVSRAFIKPTALAIRTKTDTYTCNVTMHACGAVMFSELVGVSSSAAFSYQYTSDKTTN